MFGQQQKREGIVDTKMPYNALAATLKKRTMTPCRAKCSSASDRTKAPLMAQNLALHGFMVRLKSSSSGDES